ncbi:MAG: flagellar type III secretion system protein FliR [Alphaproteobacteria bacterium]|nr:flagellar type III secretion system protein FliR [Pseudomonadota bacterium]TDI66370.1 MAG: flagellar type III secretion system protein FliR [Alphaproteobacteria bacterium]
MLQELLPADLFAFFLVFARIGSVMMMMPGFGERYVSPRFRLLLAGAITLLITPVIAGVLPPLPSSPLSLFVLLFGEIVVGLFFGTIGRIIMSALHTAGTVMSFQSGLANALTFDPVSSQQAAMFALFLSLAGILFVFVTDLHHLMLEAMVMSYSVLEPGTVPPIDDFSQVITRLVADSFILGVQLAAPFITVGLVFYLGIGLLARLMPQIQIFFIALPVQIFLGFLAFALSVSAMLLWFTNRFEELFTASLGG